MSVSFGLNSWLTLFIHMLLCVSVFYFRFMMHLVDLVLGYDIQFYLS